MTDVAIAAMQKRIYSFVAINYANSDMVGHTGQIPATIQAIETVDCCLGRLLESISQVGVRRLSLPIMATLNVCKMSRVIPGRLTVPIQSR